MRDEVPSPCKKIPDHLCGSAMGVSAERQEENGYITGIEINGPAKVDE